MTPLRRPFVQKPLANPVLAAKKMTDSQLLRWVSLYVTAICTLENDPGKHLKIEVHYSDQSFSGIQTASGIDEETAFRKALDLAVQDVYENALRVVARENRRAG